MMDQTRTYPPPAAHPDMVAPTYASLPLAPPGNTVQFAFTTMEGLIGHFSQWLPQQYVHSLIEMEKEIFVVRRECSLQETRLQFLKKCEIALMRTLAEIDAGRTNLDWTMGTQQGH